ncbi:MAG: ABC transporter substrate-binding protein [Desulfosarcinaceae bacterium]|nr:ABC transporter substrate-binding protein [Desulfosarcinaceae bacterium]
MSALLGPPRRFFQQAVGTLCPNNISAVLFALKGSRVCRNGKSLFAIAAVGLILSFSACAGNDTIQIAVIGPLSGKDHTAGRAMLDGVKLCVAQINESGGIRGRKVEVLAYDDQNNKKIAREQAVAIARESNALAVIGHYYSSTSVEGGRIYQQNGIPAVTSSATASEVTEGNNWYFRIVPDTNRQGKFAAIYTKAILHQDKVSIVYEQDVYGSALQRSYTRTARNLGLQIQNVWAIDTETGDIDTIFEKITHDVQEDTKPGALFLALQDHEAAKLVRLIRDEGLGLTIVGGDAIGSESFPRIFEGISPRKRGDGHYADGIYATTFFIRDIGNFTAQEFEYAFKRHYGREPDDMAATSYDAASVVIEAIKRAKPKGDLTQSRERVRNQLTTFRNVENAHKGVTGRIYFDEHGNAMKTCPFGVYLQGKLISAPVQLKPIVNIDAIIDFHKKMEEGRILALDDHFMYKTTIVYTGIDINEISNIDPRSGTFSVDFYLWFRHTESLDYSKIEFPNAVGAIHLSDPIMKMRIDDISHSSYRIKGDFQEEFNFRDYPFDSQKLNIRLRHKRRNNNDLLFVADDIGMQQNGDPQLMENPKGHPIIHTEGEWHLQNVMVFSDISATDSTLGNPQMFHDTADTDIDYSRFNVVTEIKRNAKNYVLSNLIPLFIIILLGYAMLFVPPQGPPFVARMNLGVTALLTAIILSVRASSQLPDIGYLVALDYIYFATYALLLSGIIISVAVLVAYLRGRELLVKRLEMIGRVVQPLYFFTAIGIFILLYI